MTFRRIDGRGTTLERPLNSIDLQVGRNLARLRKDQVATVDAMSVTLGVEPRVLLAMESGQIRVPAQVLMRASVAFGIPVSTFYE